MRYGDDRREAQADVSKSQVKRELLALQKLAERLLQLEPGVWAQLHFDQKMSEALQESRRIKGQNAMRRHIRLLGKLLREEDSERIVALLERVDGRHEEENRRLHRLEKLRDRLMLEEGAALTELVQLCPAADRQRIQQFIRAGKRELERGKPPAAGRKLFKYLQQLPLE